MGESEWQHASWVSTLGQWAWLIIVIISLISIFWELIILIPVIIILGIYGLTSSGISSWNIFANIIGIVIALLVIRPKFSNPSGEKDWDALYGWVLKLGDFNIPWMFIWGLLLFLFGTFWGGLSVLIPAFMLIFMGPKEYNWSSEEKKAEK